MKIDIKDIKKSIEFAFLNSKNRKNLYAMLLVNFAMILISIFMALILIIPFIGAVIFIFLYLFVILASYIMQIYNLGFSYEVTECVINSSDVPDYLKDYKPRFIEGLKIFAIRFIYSLILNLVLTPIMFVLIMFMIFVIFIGAAMASSIPLLGITFMMVFMYLFLLLIDFVSSVLTFSVLEPAMYKYINSKRVLDSVFKFSEVWELIQKMYPKNINLSLKILVINAIESLIFLPFIILLLVGIYEELIILTVISSLLLIFLVVPIAIFNIGFNYLSLPYLKGKMFKNFQNG